MKPDSSQIFMYLCFTKPHQPISLGPALVVESDMCFKKTSKTAKGADLHQVAKSYLSVSVSISEKVCRCSIILKCCRCWNLAQIFVQPHNQSGLSLSQVMKSIMGNHNGKDKIKDNWSGTGIVTLQLNVFHHYYSWSLAWNLGKTLTSVKLAESHPNLWL